MLLTCVDLCSIESSDPLICLRFFVFVVGNWDDVVLMHRLTVFDFGRGMFWCPYVGLAVGRRLYVRELEISRMEIPLVGGWRVRSSIFSVCDLSDDQ
jgi:hypothetical protein